MSQRYQIRDRLTGQFMALSVCNCHPVWTTQELADNWTEGTANAHKQTLEQDGNPHVLHIVPVGWTPAHERETWREKFRNLFDALKKFFA